MAMISFVDLTFPISCSLVTFIGRREAGSFFEIATTRKPHRLYTAISRKVVGKNVHATIPKGYMGYDQYTVPDTVAVEPTFVSFF